MWATNSHVFRKCGNSFLEAMNEDKDEWSVRNNYSITHFKADRLGCDNVEKVTVFQT